MSVATSTPAMIFPPNLNFLLIMADPLLADILFSSIFYLLMTYNYFLTFYLYFFLLSFSFLLISDKPYLSTEGYLP